MMTTLFDLQHDELTEAPPILGHFFEGWPSNKENIQRVSNDVKEPSLPSEEEASSDSSSRGADIPAPRKNSVQLGRQVMSELLDNDNVTKAVHLLQEAIEHLQMTQTGDDDQVSQIYSQIIKSLCNPTMANLVDQMSGLADMDQSILWRLFRKVVESGYTLDREAHVAVVNRLVDKKQTKMALQAIYILPRQQWDTACYRIAILLHLMQEPHQQTQEAQGLLSDYGKPFLEFANPIAPHDLPPVRIEMPLMYHISEQDQFKLWMFYQAAFNDANEEWDRRRKRYEKERKEHLEELRRQQAVKHHDTTTVIKHWAMEQFQLETRQQEVDRISTTNDNTMIFVALQNQQFEYGWQVYQAMGDAVDEDTPYIVMHLCWLAFRHIPIANMSRRTSWETRAWSVYSRFMCSEYLHPEESTEAPSFLHDLLLIASNSPEGTTGLENKRKRARYTKSMTVYQLLVRLQFDKLLCNHRVLEPILCTLLYEAKGSPNTIVQMCNKGFELWDRQQEISKRRDDSSWSMLWGLLILCVKSGCEDEFGRLLQYLIVKRERELSEDCLPSSLLAPIQAFHDRYLCYEGCYFYEYMFRAIEYTDQDHSPVIQMDDYGFLRPSQSDTLDQQDVDFLTSQQQKHALRTNINEIQSIYLAISVTDGQEQQAKKMYYSTTKAKAIIRHCLKIDRHS
ncbi:MAG: hypothetical protein EXX96DRAFT_540211 [Benjaminiella poitrasii]|nr:MAG: hypothetical protein EXX96DRAFT_540211 [Benjaminiella poitrasii]